MYKERKLRYILVGGVALFRLDISKRNLQRMIYGKGWKNMDGQDYFMFAHGLNPLQSESCLQISEEWALKLTLSRGGDISQFKNAV